MVVIDFDFEPIIPRARTQAEKLFDLEFCLWRHPICWGVPNLFSQITSVLYPSEFARCVKKFPTKRATRNLSPYDHFLALCFAQLTYRHSLRDIVCCLMSRPEQLYQMGFRATLSRSSLAYASEHRDWRLFFAVAQVLMRRAARLYRADHLQSDSLHVAFALDASIIGLSLKMFPWGYYAHSQSAAVKLHLMLSLQGNVPVWGAITEADFPDMKMLDQVPVMPGAWYIMDRGYLDFTRLWPIHQQGSWFVVRSKRHVNYRVVKSSSVPEPTRDFQITADQVVRFNTRWSRRSYPEPLRRVSIFVENGRRTLEVVTNNFEVDALDIAAFYKSRWKVELFFKWIKQHLRIRNFYGRSQNAVRCQIWSAICAYLMVAIFKKHQKIEKSLYEVLQLVSVNPFETQPLEDLLKAKPREQFQGDLQNYFVFNSN